MKRWSGEKLFACDVRLKVFVESEKIRIVKRGYGEKLSTRDVRFKVFLESANLKDYDDRVHRETFYLQHVRKPNAELGALESS